MQGRPASVRIAIAEDTLEVAKARIEAEYRRRTPTSAALHAAAREVLPGGDTRTVTYFAPYPVYMERGEGCRLTDVDGNVYIDFLNNYTSLIHGHAHPRITEAVFRQIAKGTVYATPVESQTQLARVICERVPSVERVRFCNSGTEATMSAIRAAKAFTGRDKVLKMEGGYHGTHDAAEVSVAPPLDLAGPAQAPYPVPASGGLFRGVVDDVVVAPFNDVEATAQIVERHRDDLAAVIVEPVMGAAGAIPAQPEYLHFLREATQSCDALLIFDEVISFRVGYGGAQGTYGVRPDLTAFGKIIGGGFPVGAFGGRADVMALFDPQRRKLSQSGTFNGNPVTMVAGLAAMELLTREEMARINDLGQRLRQGFRNALSAVGIKGQVTGMGSIVGVHFTDAPVNDYRSAARSARWLNPLVHLSLLSRGIFAAPRGLLCISTPMREEEVKEAVRAFREVLTELRACIAEVQPDLVHAPLSG